MKDIEWRAIFGRNFRKLILSSALIITCLFILFFVFIPILNNIKAKKELIMQKELEIKELSDLCKRYIDLQTFNLKIDQKISKNRADFELLSFLEEVSKKIGISEKISSMKPSESGPDEIAASLVLKYLTMEELTEYLNQLINSGKVLLIKKMLIKAIINKGQKSLEASMIISTLKSPQKISSS